MIILLPALAIAFAAFCVWLGVRVYNRRERWAKWTLGVTVLGLPVVYVLSFGPACSLITDCDGSAAVEVLPAVYYPILWLDRNSRDEGSGRFAASCAWYAGLFRTDKAHPWLLSNDQTLWYVPVPSERLVPRPVRVPPDFFLRCYSGNQLHQPVDEQQHQQ
jgi:hypothetical protein